MSFKIIMNKLFLKSVFLKVVFICCKTDYNVRHI
jgi:hypothetical protein